MKDYRTFLKITLNNCFELDIQIEIVRKVNFFIAEDLR